LWLRRRPLRGNGGILGN